MSLLLDLMVVYYVVFLLGEKEIQNGLLNGMVLIILKLSLLKVVYQVQ